ncbi:MULTISPECIES: hypothetical protein [unclassified Rhizobacter]|uniref:hypothetical protein n=1 Tax=unclassified Rhizobacter TaxID=2640088 RepID=UPI000AA4CB42|nr:MULTISPECIES: hypothetical protein [unclassified Rhizobacter]
MARGERAESCTHWFISYSFYHPRDWSDTAFDQEHENDLEGAIISVRKDGTPFGTMEGMITVFHTDFFAFTPAGSPYRNGHETSTARCRSRWTTAPTA